MSNEWGMMELKHRKRVYLNNNCLLAAILKRITLSPGHNFKTFLNHH